MDQNCLTEVPAALLLPSLTTLDVSNNQAYYIYIYIYIYIYSNNVPPVWWGP